MEIDSKQLTALSTIDQHHAGSALSGAAAEPRPLETQVIAQHIEQRRIRRHSDGLRLSVQLEDDALWHFSNPSRSWWRRLTQAFGLSVTAT